VQDSHVYNTCQNKRSANESLTVSYMADHLLQPISFPILGHLSLACAILASMVCVCLVQVHVYLAPSPISYFRVPVWSTSLCASLCMVCKPV